MNVWLIFLVPLCILALFGLFVLIVLGLDSLEMRRKNKRWEKERKQAAAAYDSRKEEAEWETLFSDLQTDHEVDAEYIDAHDEATCPECIEYAAINAAARRATAEFDAALIPTSPEASASVGSDQPVLPKSTTTTRSTTMSNTATVETLAAAVRQEAQRRGLSTAEVNKFLSDNGVSTPENHTVTVTATGSDFNDVRDRAVRVVRTYGPTATERSFPATVEGVTFTHTKS